MKKTNLRAAFTLIELLVVISIIAILASIAIPVYGVATMNARIIKSVADARSIGMALRMYSNDNDGAYPNDKNDYDEKITTSNDAFRSLFPTYLQNETVFTVGTSKAGPKADNKVTSAGDILDRGENHWAYVSGLNSTSNSMWPLIVDHTDGSGFYTDKETELGGTWKGTKAIVVNTDNSASAVKVLGAGSKRYLPRFDDRSKNALVLNDYMGDGAKLLEPAR
ncbi:MAG: prepilin-type N-terminal cleavage/methylation domain-containing protein [Chthoniobacteraceae bacterium]